MQDIEDTPKFGKLYCRPAASTGVCAQHLITETAGCREKKTVKGMPAACSAMYVMESLHSSRRRLQRQWAD
eukprot:scaffold264080_cov18-Prasinocladus_malaysianus.AAC.1